MHPLLKQDADDLGNILRAAVERAEAFFATIATRPASVPPADYPVDLLPEQGQGALATLAEFERRFAGGITGSAGPRYLAFVTGGVTPAALIGDWLTSAIDQNGTGESPAATAIEHEAIQKLRDLFGLGPEHDGTFVTGTTMANFVSLALARQWIGRRAGLDLSEDGQAAIGPIKVLSGTPHSTIAKSLSMLGMGRRSLERVARLPGREAVDVSALRAALERNAGSPAIVVANAGVVNTVDFDDIAAIAGLRRDFDFWLHVDGAFGGFAACSPKYRHLVDGMELADSVAIDAHKWLNVPYDAAMQFTRHKDLQVEVFANQAAYLRLPNAKAEFVERTPESSRRVRAIAAWFSLTAYGRDGYRSIVEGCCDRASELAAKIEASTEFRLLAAPRMNVVCFTLRHDDLSTSLVDGFLGRLRDGGKAFATPTTLEGVPGVRAAFSNWRTEPIDVEMIWDGFRDAARSGLSSGTGGSRST